MKNPLISVTPFEGSFKEIQPNNIDVLGIYAYLADQKEISTLMLLDDTCLNELQILKLYRMLYGMKLFKIEGSEENQKAFERSLWYCIRFGIESMRAYVKREEE